MKRPSYLRIGIGLTLLLAAAQAECQLYPVFPEPYGYAAVRVQLGWYNGTQAWYFCTTTNDIGFARTLFANSRPVLAPKLSSALVPRVMGGDTAARPLYMVTNFQNPPVFSAAPGDPLYSALWQVFHVSWLPGVTPRPITNADPASPANPTGLPGPAEADIASTQVVLDCPIVVLGPLSGIGPSPCPAGITVPGYIIPQAFAVDAYRKFVYLPAWLVYCQNPVTRRPGTAISQITDASDPALAAALKANLAPGLLNLPDSDTSDFYVMRGPKPLTQLPVVSDCAIDSGARNANFDYSPVMRYVILQRNIPPYTLVKSPDYIELLLSSGGLVILRSDQRINAATFGGAG